MNLEDQQKLQKSKQILKSVNFDNLQKTSADSLIKRISAKNNNNLEISNYLTFGDVKVTCSEFESYPNFKSSKKEIKMVRVFNTQKMAKKEIMHITKSNPTYVKNQLETNNLINVSTESQKKKKYDCLEKVKCSILSEKLDYKKGTAKQNIESQYKIRSFPESGFPTPPSFVKQEIKESYLINNPQNSTENIYRNNSNVLEGHEESFYFYDLGLVGSNWLEYQGEYKNNLKHGYGIWKLGNGEIFEGQFIEDKAYGKGKYVSLSGEILVGLWKNNVLQHTESHHIMVLSEEENPTVLNDLSINQVNEVNEISSADNSRKSITKKSNKSEECS